MQRINTNIWPTDFQIPHEEELAKEFGVARGTIRQALAGLVEAGYLQKKRKAGTRVTRPKTYASTLRIAMVREEIEADGRTYGYQLLKRMQRRDGLVLQCLHRADGTAFQFEQRTINLDAIPAAATADFTATSPNEWLWKQQPYSSVQTTIRAALPTKTEAGALEIDERDPVFVIERETYLEGVRLTKARLCHPATTYAIHTAAGHD